MGNRVTLCIQRGKWKQKIRDKVWRRSQDERKIERAIHVFKIRDSYMTPDPLCDNHLWVDNQGQEHFFHSWEDIFSYRKNQAKKYHNNMKSCGCSLCRNPRRNGFRPRQELRWLIEAKDTLDSLGIRHNLQKLEKEYEG